MENYEYPTTRELVEINQEKIDSLVANRPTFSIFPIVNRQAWTLEWEQRDNWRGFQQLRGLNGEPSYVKMQGKKAFSAEPGVYGEYMTVDEKMMTIRARDTMGTEPVNIDDLVMERQDLLNARELNLIEYVHWKALLDGQFSFVGPTGAVYGDTFPIQQVTLSDWSTHASATPIKDLLNLKSYTLGKSVVFDRGATIYANSTTIANLLLNSNAADLGGQMAISSGGVKPVKALPEINTLLSQHNLPQIVEYDEGYIRESDGQFVRWIPTDVLSIVGRRTNGDTLGEYRMLRNAQNANNAPGRYEKVIDRGEDRVPRLIEVHRGHNGGLVIYYGSAILRATC